MRPAGPCAPSFAEFTAELSKQAGRPVPYRAVTGQEHAAMLSGAGLPDPIPHVLAGFDASITAGELALTTGDLPPGRPAHHPGSGRDRRRPGRVRTLTVP